MRRGGGLFHLIAAKRRKRGAKACAALALIAVLGGNPLPAWILPDNGRPDGRQLRIVKPI